MLRSRRYIPGALVLAGWVALAPGSARAQGPTIDTPDVTSPGSGRSALGPAPGSGGAGPLDNQDVGILGGRVGPANPKGIPSNIGSPGSRPGAGPSDLQGIRTTPDQPPATVPAAGPLALPPTEEDPGPSGGLTLDQAIDLLIRDNLDLRSKQAEIPQARADVLTASLRANPVFYADAQLVPYGQYTRNRPGGQTQYDVNISYPLDLSRKRRARTLSAERAVRVVEAQYQDAVRLAIDNLYSSYVDVLQARRAVVFSEAGLNGLSEALRATERLARQGTKKQSDVARIRIQYRNSEQQVIESREGLVKARRVLGIQLGIPPEQAEGIELFGTLKYPKIDLPPLDELIGTAMAARPDVISYRLGVGRAEADVKLAYANRFQDVYVLYQPYTLQDNTPFGLKSPVSWAVGVTVPLPIYNRNQGNIERSKLNVAQTRVELAAEERQAIQEVRAAAQEYILARLAVDRIETEILPDARTLLDEVVKLYPSEVSQLDYLQAVSDFNTNARSYLDASVRLRRAMLEINTAVGRRILP